MKPSIAKRIFSVFLALILTVSAMGGTAFAASSSAPTCDEAYYATLDYYGALTESSVVKTYKTNGSKSISDYGTYDKITNLTDERTPTVTDGQVVFNLEGNVPDYFYFEGTTNKPFEDLPWTFKLSYRLNGVDTPADQLAGKTGLIEINLDVTPNDKASEYSKDNLILTAMSMFNSDDILSLEAPGAEVQLLGNLRSVLFMVMPGEEQHYTIRVGSNDFKYSGMIFLAVPATVSQLEKIADLKDAKKKVEDSYHSINDSLDVILDTLDGMSGSLNKTADGLNQLNQARSTISSGKAGVYSNADAALSDLDSVADALSPLSGHLSTASQALTDTTGTLKELTDNVVSLKSELATSRTNIKKLQEDTTNLRSLLTDLESHEKSAGETADALSSDLNTVGKDLSSLKTSLTTLKYILAHISGLSSVDGITVNGMTTDEIRSLVKKANTLHAAYLATPGASTAMTFAQFIVVAGKGTISDTQAQLLASLWQQAQDPDFESKLQEVDTSNTMIDQVNGEIGEVNTLLIALAKPTGTVIGDLNNLCDSLGSSGLTGDLKDLSELASDVMDDMKDHKGEGASLLNHVDEMGDLAVTVTQKAESTLDLVQKLDDTLNTYEPKAQDALKDAQTLTASASAGIKSTETFLNSLKSLMKNSGKDLDGGTEKALTGLAESLRKSTKGLDQTDTIRNAKDVITKLIDDEWDDHTGKIDNILNMDADASPVSLTDSRNSTPSSVQYIMRSQEIKVDDSKKSNKTETTTKQSGTVWTRIVDMFQGLWNSLIGLFKH